MLVQWYAAIEYSLSSTRWMDTRLPAWVNYPIAIQFYILISQYINQFPFSISSSATNRRQQAIKGIPKCCPVYNSSYESKALFYPFHTFCLSPVCWFSSGYKRPRAKTVQASVQSPTTIRREAEGAMRKDVWRVLQREGTTRKASRGREWRRKRMGRPPRVDEPWWACRKASEAVPEGMRSARGGRTTESAVSV